MQFQLKINNLKKKLNKVPIAPGARKGLEVTLSLTLVSQDLLSFL